MTMTMFRALILSGVLLLPHPALAAPDESGLPTAQARLYEPFSRSTEHTLGNMTLSTGSARFKVLKGTMELEYAGTMPASADTELGGARIFRVRNADAYFQGNKGKNGFCGEPVRWLGIRPIGKGEVRVTMLSIADYRAYSPSGHGLCSGDSFALATK